MNPLIKWLLILLLFYSCNHFKNNNLQNNSLLNFSKELVAKENAKIKIDANVHFKSWQIHIKEVNDTTYLTRKNYFKNSIIVYNWNTKKKIREYKLKSEGPNKVLKFDSAGFLELDKDKFLIANGYSQTYIVENDSVIHKEYWDDGGRGFGNMMNGFNKNLPVQIENNIYIFRKPPVPRVNIDYYSYNLLVEFDLEKQNLKECLVKYPNSYKVGECWGFPALRQSFTLNNKNQLIFSFPIDHSLYSYSLLDKTFTKILKPTNSSFDIEFKPFPNCDDELIGNEYNYYVKSTARYESIKYDEYNNLYYRIVLFPPKNLDKKNVNNLDMDISIMVLDSDFNLIAEKRLPNNTYDYDDFFVTKDGFWLSKNNTNNPNFNEEIMTFDLFILKNSK